MPVSRALSILSCLVALFAAPAGADETTAPTPPPSRSAILAHFEGSGGGASWLAAQLNHVRVDKKSGFAYTRNVAQGERPLQWSVQGPAVGRKKAVGLGFELRF